MCAVIRETLPVHQERLAMGLALGFTGNAPTPKGEIFYSLRDSVTGEVTEGRIQNTRTYDASIAIALHLSGVLTSGITMLAVGTGATGNILSPDAPQMGQRALNTEIQRKAFSSVIYRTSEGVAVAYPTNIVDFTTIYSESEAVGALNEMGLLVPASSNPSVRNPILNGPSDYDPTIDVTGKDLLANYLTFGVISKPSTAVLQLTWRLTF